MQWNPQKILDVGKVICTVDWVATDLNRDIEKKRRLLQVNSRSFSGEFKLIFSLWRDDAWN